jgi:hypothetical protein
MIIRGYTRQYVLGIIIIHEMDAPMKPTNILSLKYMCIDMEDPLFVDHFFLGSNHGVMTLYEGLREGI